MFGRRGRRRSDAPSGVIGDDKPETTASVGELLSLLQAIETAAGQVYGRHGLPQQPGHYRRPAEGGAWMALGDALSPADRWSLIRAAPADERWRYSAYEGLGARSDIPVVRQASALLAACQGLRQRLAERALISPQDLADSIRLGEAWRRLVEDAGHDDPSAEPLHFLPPEED